MLWRTFCLSFLSLAALQAYGDIEYRLKPDLAAKHYSVDVRFAPKSRTVLLQMPTWAPGIYIETDFWRNVSSVSATDERGAAISVTHPSPDTWSFDAGSAKTLDVHYEVPLSPGGFFGGYSSEGKALHAAGPATFMYVVDRKQERCRLDVDIPADWKIAVGLKPAPSKDGSVRTYFTKNYDVLVDNPITMGDFPELHYQAFGKDEFIAMRGDQVNAADPARLVEACKFITEAEGDFFGGTPYDTYTWHLTIGSGGAGLEHASSSEIGIGPTIDGSACP